MTGRRRDVSRPVADIDIVLYDTGRAEVAVLRPEAVATVHETAHVGSVEAFGQLLDRVVELITWNGEPKDDGGTAGRGARAHPAAEWVLGHDGDRWPVET